MKVQIFAEFKVQISKEKFAQKYRKKIEKIREKREKMKKKMEKTTMNKLI